MKKRNAARISNSDSRAGTCCFFSSFFFKERNPALLKVKGHTGVVTSGNPRPRRPLPSALPLSLSSIYNCEGKHCRSLNFLHPADPLPPSLTFAAAFVSSRVLNTLLISSGSLSAGRVKEDVKLFEAMGRARGIHSVCPKSNFCDASARFCSPV